MPALISNTSNTGNTGNTGAARASKQRALAPGVANAATCVNGMATLRAIIAPIVDLRIDVDVAQPSDALITPAMMVEARVAGAGGESVCDTRTVEPTQSKACPLPGADAPSPAHAMAA